MCYHFLSNSVHTFCDVAEGGYLKERGIESLQWEEYIILGHTRRVCDICTSTFTYTGSIGECVTSVLQHSHILGL